MVCSKPALGRIEALAHQRLWQALPRKLRRNVLVGLSTTLAPRPQAVHARCPVIVAGFLTAASGLGASARLCHDALLASGLPVMGIDLTARFRQDGSRVSFSYADGAGCRGPATLILHVNSPFLPLALWWLGRKFIHGKFVAGYWAWELPAAPPEWRAGLPFVHHILATSAFTAAAIKGLGVRTPVDVLFHPAALTVQPMPRPSRGRQPFTALVVFNMASSFQRKNPMASLAAFLAAFGGDAGARLVVKMQNPGSFPAGAHELRRAAAAHANVVLDERTASSAEMNLLYASSDVVLSLHRSEGFGLVVAEAMLAGRPVIATNWSGNTDFLTAETGIPVSYRLVPAVDPQGEYHDPRTCWAEADIGEAAAALRRLRAEPEMRSRLGRAAAEQAAKRFSAAAYVDRLKLLLGLS